MSLICALSMSTRALAQEAAAPAPTEAAPIAPAAAPADAPAAAAPAAAAPAQAAPAPSAPLTTAPPAQPAPTNVMTTPPPPAAEEEQEVDDSETDPMSWFGIGPKVGLIMPRLFARAVNRRIGVKYDAKVDPTRIPSDVQLPVTGADFSQNVPVADTYEDPNKPGGDVLVSIGVPIYLGDGHGISLDVEGLVAFCASCEETRGNYTLLAVYGGLAYRFQPIDPLYVSIGLGIRPGIATVKNTVIGTQGELRMPFTFTYYVHKSVGVFFEIAPGFGGYVDILDDVGSEAAAQANHARGSVEGDVLGGGILPVEVPYSAADPVPGSADALAFAFGGSLDISIGARFP